MNPSLTFEARFLAGRARLAFSPPGSWPRSPQLALRRYAYDLVCPSCGGIMGSHRPGCGG